MKLLIRYIMIVFVMFLAYTVTSAEYLNIIKSSVEPMTLNVIVGAVFGALTLILKSHFESKIDPN